MITPLFFEWSYENYPVELETLLSGTGKDVCLYADIAQAKHDAVKFSAVGIQVVCEDPILNDKLEELLKVFKVTLEHSGVSRYKYEGKTYRIDSNGTSGKNIEFCYGYGEERRSYGNYPSLINQSALKIKFAGETQKIPSPILSPYTSWKIKIEPTADHEGRKKQAINNLANVIKEAKQKDLKLMLIGYGQYIDDSNTRVLKELDKFYSLNLVSPLITANDNSPVILSQLEQPNSNAVIHQSSFRLTSYSSTEPVDSNEVEKIPIRDFNSLAGKLSAIQKHYGALSSLKIKENGEMSDELKRLRNSPEIMGRLILDLGELKTLAPSDSSANQHIACYIDALRNVLDDLGDNNVSASDNNLTNLYGFYNRMDEEIKKITKEELQLYYKARFDLNDLFCDLRQGEIIQHSQIDKIMRKITDLNYDTKEKHLLKKMGYTTSALNYLVKDALEAPIELLCINDDGEASYNIKHNEQANQLELYKNSILTTSSDSQSNPQPNYILKIKENDLYVTDCTKAKEFIWIANTQHRPGHFFVTYLARDKNDNIVIVGEDQNMGLSNKEELPLNLPNLKNLLSGESLESLWGKAEGMILMPTSEFKGNGNANGKLTKPSKIFEQQYNNYIENANNNCWFAAPLFIAYLVDQLEEITLEEIININQ